VLNLKGKLVIGDGLTLLAVISLDNNPILSIINNQGEGAGQREIRLQALSDIFNIDLDGLDDAFLMVPNPIEGFIGDQRLTSVVRAPGGSGANNGLNVFDLLVVGLPITINILHQVK